MLLKHRVLERIRAGEISEVYRRWKRPTVKTGGTLNTAAGRLRILAVEAVSDRDLTGAAARRAGFDSADALRASLREGDNRTLYRVRLELAGDDPRIALRASDHLEQSDVAALQASFARLDRSVEDERLTALALLRLIGDNEAVRAPDLAAGLGVETAWFKNRVRRLKAQGLTESLRIGYRLSPRGWAVLERLG